MKKQFLINYMKQWSGFKRFFFWKLLCVQDCISYPEIQMLLVRNQPEQLDLNETQKLRLK